MPKPNFKFQKRQKDLAKKKKREEKLQRKLERKQEGAEIGTVEHMDLMDQLAAVPPANAGVAQAAAVEDEADKTSGRDTDQGSGPDTDPAT